MFCHRCGTEVAANLNFCPKCGQVLAPGAGAYAPPSWTPLRRIRSRSWHWIGEGWRIVQAELGMYAVLALITILLSSVPFLTGPLIAGFLLSASGRASTAPPKSRIYLPASTSSCMPWWLHS
ncbi:MAG: zinc ribbon domain-containing protein [Acidobacteriia bacterium]|nr:zinc ribbon domain-containing protein [Terriglobia bacterium]